MAQIWQVRISNGKTHYFDNQVEAEFVSKDAVECGFTAFRSTIAVPKTAREFTSLMEAHEEEKQILGIGK
jgi:hypothetical protein